MNDNKNLEIEKHIAAQRRYFDKISSEFQPTISDEVEFCHSEIVNYAKIEESSFILDVATGKGALLRHIKNKAVLSQNIYACDVSQSMLDEAAVKYPDIPSENFICLPVESFLSDGRFREFVPSGFDVIFLNGCFGNFYDQHDVLVKAGRAVKPGGRVCISHPLGSQFVRRLQEESPDIVPNTLPNRDSLELMAATANFHITEYRDDAIFVAILEISD